MQNFDKYYSNEKIPFNNMLVLDENGNKLGYMSKEEALQAANDSGLDLVCVSVKERVCKLINLSKYLYEQKKNYHKSLQNNKSKSIKEYHLRYNIATNDLDIKIRQARENISKGHRVNITIVFKGREIAHKNLGENIIRKFSESLLDIANIENPVSFHDNVYDCLLSPKKLR